jgi:hypothetical protein
MSRPSQKVKLIKVSTGKLVEAVLYEGIDGKNLQDYEKLWKPMMAEANLRARELKAEGKEYVFVEDEHWNWRNKLVKTEFDSLSYEHFVIECDGRTQGLLQLNLTLHRSIKNSSLELVYVDYVSTAPWNRERIADPIEFRAVGTILIAQAIGSSINQGFKGRLGLHSLPSAAGWYKKMGFTSYGKDENAHGLEYFELDETSAQKILKTLEKK